MKRLLSVMVVVAFCVAVIVPAFNVNAEISDSITNVISESFYDGIKDAEFAGDGAVYVTMHHEISDVGKVYTENDFPELEIVHVQCNYNYEGYFNDYKYRYLEDNEYDSEFMVKIYLKHWSKKNYRDAIIKLSPRVDVDIKDIQIVSYSLNDVSKILKCVAGWEGYTYHDLIVETAETGTVFDLVYDDKITLADASMILKIIAGWDIATF